MGCDVMESRTGIGRAVPASHVGGVFVTTWDTDLVRNDLGIVRRRRVMLLAI